jgi:CheY-like chemotaxis protein
MTNVLVIDDNAPFANALVGEIDSPIPPLITGEHTMGEVIDRLEALEGKSIEAIYLSAELTFKENSSRSAGGGIELLKHIRLTQTLPSIRLVPIVIGVWREASGYLRLESSNACLFSPGVLVLPQPFSIGSLVSSLKKLQRFDTISHMYSEVKNYFPISEKDKVSSEHDYRNRVGIAKLVQELPMEVMATSSVVVEDLERFKKTTLWLKKLEFHQQVNVQPAQFASLDVLKKVRAECEDVSILLVDDEHRRGWSYMLHRVLIGECPEEPFQNKDHYVSVSDGRFQCIDSSEAASEYFKQQSTKLEEGLIAWSKAEARLTNCREQDCRMREVLPTKLKQLEEQRLVKKKTVGELQRRLAEAEKKVFKAESQLEQLEANFTFTYADIANLLKHPEAAVPGLTEILEARENHDRLLNEWNGANEGEKHTVQEIETLDKELAELQNNRELISQHLEAAENEYKHSLNELNACFRHDLIFLDLRLDPTKDSQRDVSEASGNQLLKQIKQFDPSIPVIVLTASQKALSYSEVLELGAEGYWIKGVSRADELMQIISALSHGIVLRRRLWRKIRQIESRTTLRRWRVRSDATLEEEKVSEQEEIEKIKAILRQCYAFVVGKEAGVARAVTRLDRHQEIALRLGQIREFRIYFPEDLKPAERKIWPELRRKKLVKPEDETIRNYRNITAHFYTKSFESFRKVGADVDPREVLQSFEYTLDALIAS